MEIKMIDPRYFYFRDQLNTALRFNHKKKQSPVSEAAYEGLSNNKKRKKQCHSQAQLVTKQTLIDELPQRIESAVTGMRTPIVTTISQKWSENAIPLLREEDQAQQVQQDIGSRYQRQPYLLKMKIKLAQSRNHQLPEEQSSFNNEYLSGVSAISDSRVHKSMYFNNPTNSSNLRILTSQDGQRLFTSETQRQQASNPIEEYGGADQCGVDKKFRRLKPTSISKAVEYHYKKLGLSDVKTKDDLAAKLIGRFKKPQISISNSDQSSRNLQLSVQSEEYITMRPSAEIIKLKKKCESGRFKSLSTVNEPSSNHSMSRPKTPIKRPFTPSNQEASKRVITSYSLPRPLISTRRPPRLTDSLEYCDQLIARTENKKNRLQKVKQDEPTWYKNAFHGYLLLNSHKYKKFVMSREKPLKGGSGSLIPSPAVKKRIMLFNDLSGKVSPCIKEVRSVPATIDDKKMDLNRVFSVLDMKLKNEFDTESFKRAQLFLDRLNYKTPKNQIFKYRSVIAK